MGQPLVSDFSSMDAYLNSSLQSKEGIPSVAHPKDAPKSILRQVSNFEDFKIWRHGAQVELIDQDVIDDNGRLRGLVQSSR